ncbi:hypothetical protein ACP3V3_02780 [Vibrio sp. PNB22_3_1]
MQKTDRRILKSIITALRNEATQSDKLISKLLDAVICAKESLRETITVESVIEDCQNIDKLRERYLVTRFSQPIGHNATLSTIERISRTHSQENINLMCIAVWQRVIKARAEI